MAVSVAIDSFRLSCDPLTSNCVYITELVNSFEENASIEKVFLLLPYRADSFFQYGFLGEKKKVQFVYPKRSHDPNKNWFTQTWWIQGGVLQCLRQIESRVDYLISPYHQVPVFLSRKTKSVVVIHDICGLDTFLYPRLKKGFYKHYFNFITSIIRAEIFIPISEFTKNQFVAKFPFLSGKVSKVVYNRVSASLIGEEIMNHTLSVLQLKYHSYFLAIGAMGPRKGLDLLIDGYKNYQDQGGASPFLLIVGRSQVNLIKEMLQKNSIKNVKVISGVTNEERDALYRGALALVFPSRCEGFGFPVLEAIVQGCPPIAWINSPALEIMGESEAFLRELSAKAITEQLFKYDALNSEERTEISLRLKERARMFLNQDFGKVFYEAMTENVHSV